MKSGVGIAQKADTCGMIALNLAKAEELELEGGGAMIVDEEDEAAAVVAVDINEKDKMELLLPSLEDRALIPIQSELWTVFAVDILGSKSPPVPGAQ